MRAEDVRETFDHLESQVIRTVGPEEYAALVAAAAAGPQVDDPGSGPGDPPPGPTLVRAPRPDEPPTRGELNVGGPAPTTNRPVPDDVANPFRT